MDLETVKLYLRIDCNDDDGIIALLMEVAEEYIEAAVGNCDFSRSKVKLLFLVIMQDLYDNRSMITMATSKSQQKLSYTVATILQQLQIEKMMEDENGN